MAKSGDYTPGKGSYKVEEAGAIRGVGTSGNVCHQMGTLSFGRDDFSVAARGLNLALSSRFSSDWLYSSVIRQIAKGEQPAGTLMTLPGGNTNFYRFAAGWSWDLPYVMIGEKNAFLIVVGGATYDLSSAITGETWGEADAWVEGYHIKYGDIIATYYRPLTIAIPEAKAMLTCTIKQEGSAPHDYIVQCSDTYPFKLYMADGSLVEFKLSGESASGHVRRITDPAGKNSLTFSYAADGLSGTIVGLGAPARSKILIDQTGYEAAEVGDLITVRDEVRVIWSKGDSYQIEVSGGFNFTPTTSDTYHISKGKLQKIVHNDGRCVKFYYYTLEGLNRITTVLSSDSDMGDFTAEDLFLNRYTLDSDKRLVKFEVLDTIGAVGWAADGTDDPDHFTPLQENTYSYHLTDDPSPETDFLAICSHAGAATKYLFQKGGFCTHTFNNIRAHGGRVRDSSSLTVLDIERPDFLVEGQDYFNVSRIETEQFEATGRRGKPDYKACSSWVTIDVVRTSTQIKLSGSLAEKPKRDDLCLIIDNAVVKAADRFSTKDSSDKNSRRVFMSTTGLVDGDYLAIRNEIRRIETRGTEDSFTYADVEEPFSFLPKFTGGKDHILVINASAEPEFHVYYLNKPKVVKIEQQGGDVSWKSVSYRYTYLKGGNETSDDLSGGGFIEADVDGPSDKELESDAIQLLRTTITTWKDGPEPEDYTQTVIDFGYDYNARLIGQSSSKSYVRAGEGWKPLGVTVNVSGHPCTNAPYWGVTSFYEYRDTCEPDGVSWKSYTDLDYDGYGRVIRSRKYSPALPGGQSINRWTQYVGIGTGESLDPYGEFEANPYSGDYQSRFNSKLSFEVVGATVDQVNGEGLKHRVYHKFDTNLNVTETSVVEESTLDAADRFTPYPQGQFYGDSFYWDSMYDSHGLVLPAGPRSLLSAYAYDVGDGTGNTNVLTKLTKPEANEVNLVYGSSWKSSYIVRDYLELETNLDTDSQYIVNFYDYDIKGRLVNKQTILAPSSSGTTEKDGTKYPRSAVAYAYDGLDRVTLKRGGSDANPANLTDVVKQEYDDNYRLIVATDYLGFRTKTWYDALFRSMEVKSYKPSGDAYKNLTHDEAYDVLIGWSKTRYEPVLGAVVEQTRYSSADGEPGHRTITRAEYDKLGRPVRSWFKNTDSSYSGDGVFKLLSEIQYDDTRNSVLTRSYLDEQEEGSGFVQALVENDWLGRGPTREHSWTGKNGTGKRRTVESFYDHAGRLVEKRLPSGERYRFFYDSAGKPEKTMYPDGSCSVANYDKNGRLIRSRDRREVSTFRSYNQADLETQRIGFGNNTLSIDTLQTHHGPARITESEFLGSQVEILKNEYEYHWSGAVEKASQAADSKTRYLESTYDAAGNLVAVKATSAGGWSKELAVDSQYHPGGSDSDPFNRLAVLDGATAKVILEGSFLGLASKTKYGTGTAREVAYGYDGLLRLKSLVSNEGTPELNVQMSRDFVGNVLTRESSNYTYDGMHRMVIGEAESYAYDELSNLSRRGSTTYRYQPAGERDKNQMRLAMFNDGSDHALGYDREGNVVSVEDRFDELVYDNLGRLREVTHDSQTDKYGYDAGGLRFRREQGSEVVYTMHSGDWILFQEKYSSGVLAESQFNLIAGGQILGQVRKVGASEPVYLYFGLDNLGSRRVVWNADGTVKVKFNYSAWGEYSRVGGVAADEWLACFTGKEYDATGLLYFNARYYDPVVGRFLTEDPSRKGHSWYTYCANNPLTYTDPTGMREIVDEDRYGRPVLAPPARSFANTTSRTAPPPVPMGTRGVAGAGAMNRAPITVLRGEEFIGRPFGHFGEGYTEFIPASASCVDCTQFTGYASNRPVTGSGEYPTSRNYVRVDVPSPGDTVVWRATSLAGERVGHAAILTGETGERALLQAYGPEDRVVYTSMGVVQASYEAAGYTDTTVEYYRPR